MPCSLSDGVSELRTAMPSVGFNLAPRFGSLFAEKVATKIGDKRAYHRVSPERVKRLTCVAVVEAMV